MLDYIEGVIKHIGNNTLILENQGFGFKIYISNKGFYKLNDHVKLYLYNFIREDEYSLYGFHNCDERNLFFLLIGVKGLGPKTAIKILEKNTEEVIKAITDENIVYLKQFSKIGDKLAKQIILDLKGELTSSYINSDLFNALKNLGYKRNEILNIISKIDQTLDLENQIKFALNLLSN